MLFSWAQVFIELFLLLVHTIGIHVSVMADGERPDDAVIGSRFSVRGCALPDQKNLLREALDVVAVFHFLRRDHGIDSVSFPRLDSWCYETS